MVTAEILTKKSCSTLWFTKFIQKLSSCAILGACWCQIALLKFSRNQSPPNIIPKYPTYEWRLHDVTFKLQQRVEIQTPAFQHFFAAQKLRCSRLGAPSRLRTWEGPFYGWHRCSVASDFPELVMLKVSHWRFGLTEDIYVNHTKFGGWCWCWCWCGC